jgi:Protein of unknown function (DUF1329)
MKNRTLVISVSLVLALAGTALGAVSAEEAKKLGTTLTDIGAEKAGNKDGTIPPYTGGITTPPANYKKNSGVRPDPFASEKPLFSIDYRNMEKYADKLTEGTKALMKKYHTYRVDVYKTHRTVAFPKYVLENTLKNATRAKTADGGIKVEGAKAGFPFSIPKNGYEAMWNHLLRFNGQAYDERLSAWNIDSTGRLTMSGKAECWQEYPYYNTKEHSEIYYELKCLFDGPPRRDGEYIMLIDPLNVAEKGRTAYQYLPGQRRVKLAPELDFDTPNSSTAGASTYDDLFVFTGSMERYNWKLIGKKEVYVPYNCYKAAYLSSAKDLYKPGHMNPDLIRWELHRVWIVEATLRPGKRHIYSRRTFYLDEDSWAALTTDSYDGRGQLYRVTTAYQAPSYDVPSSMTDFTSTNDLISGIYATAAWAGNGGKLLYIKPLPHREWTPAAMAGAGIR